MATSLHPVHRRWFAPLALIVPLVVAACGGSSAPTTQPGTSSAASQAASEPAASAPPSEVASESAAPSESEAASTEPSESAGATGIPTSIDPATLVTTAELKQLTGVDFGTCAAHTTQGNLKTCSYTTTTNVFTVVVGQAPDEATAQAGKATFKQMIETATKGQAKVTELPDLADGAAIIEASGGESGITLGVIGIYILKGTIYFGLSDVAVGGKPPSQDAMKAEAQTVLGRIP